MKFSWMRKVPADLFCFGFRFNFECQFYVRKIKDITFDSLALTQSQYVFRRIFITSIFALCMCRGHTECRRLSNGEAIIFCGWTHSSGRILQQKHHTNNFDLIKLIWDAQIVKNHNIHLVWSDQSLEQFQMYWTHLNLPIECTKWYLILK